MIKMKLDNCRDIVYVADYLTPIDGSVTATIKPGLPSLFESYFMSEAIVYVYPICFKGKAATIKHVDTLLDALHKQYPKKSVLAYIELRNNDVQVWFCIDGKDFEFDAIEWLDSYVSKKPLLSKILGEIDNTSLCPEHLLAYLQKREWNAEKSEDCMVRKHTRNMKVAKTLFNKDVDRFIKENKLVDWPNCEVYQNYYATYYIYSQRTITDRDVPKWFLRKDYKPTYQVIMAP